MELTLTLSSIEPIVPIYLVTVINTLKYLQWLQLPLERGLRSTNVTRMTTEQSSASLGQI